MTSPGNRDRDGCGRKWPRQKWGDCSSICLKWVRKTMEYIGQPISRPIFERETFRKGNRGTVTESQRSGVNVTYVKPRNPLPHTLALPYQNTKLEWRYTGRKRQGPEAAELLNRCNLIERLGKTLMSQETFCTYQRARYALFLEDARKTVV